MLAPQPKQPKQEVCRRLREDASFKGNNTAERLLWSCILTPKTVYLAALRYGHVAGRDL